MVKLCKETHGKVFLLFHQVESQKPHTQGNPVVMVTPTLTIQQKTLTINSAGVDGRLKARWRRLLKQNDMSMENVPNVVASCCVLHNK
jgi:hypothetical protein